jgi:hypothetical protein
VTYFALFIALLGCGLGWLTVRGNPLVRAKLIGAGFAAMGLGGGWFIYSTDQQLRGETLYEVMAEGSMGAAVNAPAPVRQLEFVVEHPGVEHTLMISPSSYRAADPTGAAELSFELKDPDGNRVLGEKRVYEVRSSGRSSSDWDASYHRFVPSKSGTYVLELVILTVDVPQVHIRVADPEKTDGQRIPGF